MSKKANVTMILYKCTGYKNNHPYCKNCICGKPHTENHLCNEYFCIVCGYRECLPIEVKKKRSVSRGKTGNSKKA